VDFLSFVGGMVRTRCSVCACISVADLHSNPMVPSWGVRGFAIQYIEIICLLLLRPGHPLYVYHNGERRQLSY